MKSRVLTLAAAAPLTLGALVPGIASADNVIPGADTSGVVVVSGSPALKVTVNAAGAAATSVTGTVSNTSTDMTFVCAGPSGKEATTGTISTAATVSKASGYYASELYRRAPAIPLEFKGLPLIGNLTLGNLDFGSAEGSLAPVGSLLGDANAARKEVLDTYTTSRVEGHAGDIPAIPAAELSPGTSFSFSVPLPPPTHGARTDFDAAAFLLCTDNVTKQPFVFTGYESGTTPPAATAAGSGSLGTGILGKGGLS